MPPKFAPVPGLSGPPPMPFSGARGNVSQFLKNPLAYLGMIHGRYGRVAAITRNNPMMVSVLGPEYNKQILSDPKQFFTANPEAVEVTKSSDNPLSRLLNSVVVANGPRHVQQRKLIMPALHHKALPAYFAQMVATTLDTIEPWKPGDHKNMFEEMQRITLRIAMKVLLGIDPAAHGGDRLGALYAEWMERHAALSSLLFSRNILPGTALWQVMRVSSKLEEHAKRVIEFKRKNLGNDVLSMLIQAVDEGGERLNEAELLGNTHILFIIGHQTMTDVMTWALFALSQHPEVLATVQQELDTVLGGGPPTFDKLSQLQRLNWAIDEALRLLGPTIFQIRIAQDRFALGPLELPKGTWMIFSPHYTHRMPETFPDPNRYRPWRWETAKPTPYEYIPFTFGAHGCIGPQFAYAEMKIVLSLLLQRFQPALAANARIDPGANPTLAPKQGMPIKLLSRKTAFELNRPRGEIHDIIELV